MNKKTPVPAYRLLSNPSNKLKLFINHYETPCISSFIMSLKLINGDLLKKTNCVNMCQLKRL